MLTNHARIVCFDGEDDTMPKFSQADLSKMIAEDRKKTSQQVATIQKTLEETLTSKNLTVKEREELAAKLDDVQRQSMTREQALAHDKKQAEDAAKTRVAEAEKREKAWEAKFKEQLVESTLDKVTADPDFFQPSQVKTILKGFGVQLEQVRDEATGQMTDRYEVVVPNFEDRNGAGEKVFSKYTPEQAVKRMKELSAVYGNMVRSSIVSGIGSGSGAGVATGQGIDPRNMSTAQYMELRKKNPAALGLRAGRK
jgi:hypothetical protein